MKDEALQMCLEYIETDAHERRYVRHAIKQALAEPVQDTEAHYKGVVEGVQKLFDDKRAQPAPVQEPVAWMFPDDLKRFETSEAYAEAYSIKMGSPTQGQTVPLYTTPPTAQRQWVGLTDEEIEQGCKESWVTEQAWQSAVWWAEAKLRSKNT
jgi:hypothetical protein